MKSYPLEISTREFFFPCQIAFIMEHKSIFISTAYSFVNDGQNQCYSFWEDGNVLYPNSGGDYRGLHTGQISSTCTFYMQGKFSDRIIKLNIILQREIQRNSCLHEKYI